MFLPNKRMKSKMYAGKEKGCDCVHDSLAIRVRRFDLTAEKMSEKERKREREKEEGECVCALLSK
jgi:hypothetical protein